MCVHTVIRGQFDALFIRSYLLYVCVCVCSFICTCMCIYTHVYECACIQSSNENLRCCFLSTLQIFFEAGSFTGLELHQIGQGVWPLSSRSQLFSVSHLYFTDIAGVHHHSQFLHGSWGSEFRSSRLHGRHFIDSFLSPVPLQLILANRYLIVLQSCIEKMKFSY